MSEENKLLELARKRFKLCQDAEAGQRKREMDDLRFQVPELQWDDAARIERQGGTAGAQQYPARPILSIDKLAQPRQLINNQARAARLGVNIHPVSEDADKEGAEIRQGLYRRIERDSNADHARLWALDRATACGRGAYRVSTKYDEDAPVDPDDPAAFDQEIAIERILHQETVYFDPACTKPDFSDMNYAFVAAWMQWDDFRREFPKTDTAKLAPNSKQDWQGAWSAVPSWVRTNNDGTESLLVVEYWERKREVEEIEVQGRTRKKETVTVTCTKICGVEVLETQEWAGKYIPLIAVIGRELQPFNEERYWQGMIGPAKDGQKAYNFAASTLIERMALEPKVPWVMAEGQQEGYEDQWAQANRRNFPYLIYKPTTAGDELAPPPTRTPIDASGMNIAMIAMQEADRFIQTTTSVYDPSLGRESSRDKSGKAILALQQQSDAGTGHFLASLADISMRYEARVVLDLMPHIYDRPGRVTTILKGDDDSQAQAVMLNAPFVMQQGRPVPAEGMPDNMDGMKEYDLSKGKYSISVDIGKSFQTRLQAGQEFFANVAQSFPQVMEFAGDLFFRYQDAPGSTAIADRFKKVIAAKMPGLIEEGDPDSPETLKAKLDAATQQLQEMQQQLQAAAQEIETQKARQEAQIITTREKVASAEKIAAQGNQTKIVVEQMKQGHERAEAMKDRDQERDIKEFEAAHETAQSVIAASGPPPERPVAEGGKAGAA